MSLVGNLEDLPLADILQIVSLSKRTGILTIETEEGKNIVVFKNGLIVSFTLTLLRLPVADGAIFPRRSGRADVVRTGVMFAGTLIKIIIAPRILRNGFQVRSMPPGGVARLLHQIIEAIMAFGVVASIDLEGVQRSLKIGDLGLSCGDFGLFSAAHHLW